MVQHSKENVLNKTERESLINTCKSEKEKLVIAGLLYTGMRAGEFAQFNISWISWQDQKITIPREQGDWKPKTSSGAREIPLMNKARSYFFAWFDKYNKVGLTRTSIFRIVRQVAKRTNLKKKVYPHSLRATFASMMAERGLAPADIQMIMGWSKLETANNYVKSTQSFQNFMSKMED